TTFTCQTGALIIPRKTEVVKLICPSKPLQTTHAVRFSLNIHRLPAPAQARRKIKHRERAACQVDSCASCRSSGNFRRPAKMQCGDRNPRTVARMRVRL